MRRHRSIQRFIVAAGVWVLLALGLAGPAMGCEFTLKFGGEPQSQLHGPRDVAIDSEGNAWVADTGRNLVKKFNPSGEFASQFEVQAASGSPTRGTDGCRSSAARSERVAT